jgi:hypothetical protein
LLLFGGSSVATKALLNDTWTWQGGCWTQRFPSVSPSPRAYMAAAYDPGRHLVIAYGFPGVVSDTWSWDGTNWSLVAPTAQYQPSGGKHAGPDLFFPAMSYDPATKSVIMLGADTFSLFIRSKVPCETWSWTGSAWQRLHPSSAPGQRTNASLAPDPAYQGMVLFGGNKVGDTWTWNGLTWTQRNGPGPGGRAGQAFALDELRHLDVLAGGAPGTAPPYRDTWLWDGAHWTQAPVTHFPPPIGPLGYAVAVDTGQQVLLVEANFDMLVWSGSDWSPP